MEFNKKLFFDRCVSFVGDLAVVFGNKQHSLLLYNRLLEKIRPTHKDEITRQVGIFSQFITENREGIVNKNFDLFKMKHISYNDKVNIKMDEIFKMSDNETTPQIWNHLLYIYNALEPTGEAAEILKKSLSEESTESDFLQNLCKKIENNVDENADPMTAVMGMMQNGVFTELLGSMQQGIQSGSLDMNKLFSTVQGMMGSMGANGASMPDLSQMASMLGGAMNKNDESKN